MVESITPLNEHKPEIAIANAAVVWGDGTEEVDLFPNYVEVKVQKKATFCNRDKK